MTTDFVYTFNIEGQRIGEKPIQEINKITDILEAVYVKVFIDDKILLSKIIQKPGGLKKMHEGKWGTPIATIVRLHETPEEAFKRASISDIGLIPEITCMYPRTPYEFENGSKRHIYEFETKLEKVPLDTGREFCLVNTEDIQRMISAGEVAETYMKLM